MQSNPHRVRQREQPPNELTLISENGQFQMVVAFRKGQNVEWYIRFRRWCWANDVNPSDVFNSLIEPITHFCENFARRDNSGNIIVPFNLGEVVLEQYYSKSYVNRPLQDWGNPAFNARQKKLRQTKHRLS